MRFLALSYCVWREVRWWRIRRQRARQAGAWHQSLFRFDRIETGLWIPYFDAFSRREPASPRIKSGAGFRWKRYGSCRSAPEIQRGL